MTLCSILVADVPKISFVPGCSRQLICRHWWSRQVLCARETCCVFSASVITTLVSFNILLNLVISGTCAWNIGQEYQTNDS